MAKVYHENVYNIIQGTLTDAKDRGVIHLHSDNDSFTGRLLHINDTDKLNFGTCGYLGLEIHPNLVEGAVDYVRRYGTQFSMSRTYVSMPLNEELESMLSEMYDGLPTIIQSSTSITHLSMVPVLVGVDDVVILDQQAHASMQSVVQIAASGGTTVTMIRHNDMNMLEHTIQKWSDKKKKIWYIIDGVYSMFGDPPRTKALEELMERYPQLHIYVDDAHGMSWFGPKGSGYFYNHFKLNDRVVFVSTLAKGFGSVGGFAVFHNRKDYEKIRIYGGPLTHSHPLAPASVGASIASARMHLSGEITAFQQKLQARVALCSRLLAQTTLPVISHPETPIFFVGVKHPRLGYNILGKMLAEGYYFNIALFPAVPAKNTGLRFTITNHVTEADITNFVKALDRNYQLALAEEGVAISEINKAFNIAQAVKEASLPQKQASGYKVQVLSSIQQVEKSEWDPLFEDEGLFNWEGLRFMEAAFSGHELPEQNWQFFYLLVRSPENNRLICATFFTLSLFKDDFLSPAEISAGVEKLRHDDKYYLTSRTLMMGSTLTEGQHLYIDKSRTDWKEALDAMFKEIFAIQEREKADNIILRDFAEADLELKSVFHDHGFSSVKMPPSNIIDHITWNNTDELLSQLSARNRRHLRYEVLKHAHLFDVEVKQTLTPQEQAHFYQLFLNVKHRNTGVNFFDYPPDITARMSEDPNWEFISVKFGKESGIDNDGQAIACGWCFKGRSAYIPVIIGMDYKYVFDYHTYKQTLFQMLKRGRELGYRKVYFGFSADTEKRKLGALQIAKTAYIYMSDNYHFELLEAIRN